MPDSERLSRESRYSLDDLIDGAGRVVEDWGALPSRQHAEAFPKELHDELVRMLSATGRWIQDGSPEIDEDLLQLFRDLAFCYRSKGFSLGEALEGLGALEDMLAGDLPRRVGDETPPSLLLRRAMRALWTETVHLNYTLDRRRHRENTEALETFEEILSHELGNRLGAARTGVEILRESAPALSEARRDDLLELIADGVDEALKTVDDVSAFIQTQRLDENVAPLSDVVASVTAGIKTSARAAGVRLEVVDSIPAVEVDSGRLRLVLSNLLVNGIRYCDPDEEDPRVLLRAGLAERSLRLEVEDNGLGMSEADQRRVFQYQKRGSNGNGADGSGLGLTIVKEAVSQMGGRIEVESEAGAGSTFRVVLPRTILSPHE